MLGLFLWWSHDALIIAGRLHIVQQCVARIRLGEAACGGWRWLSGCLDRLDKDIKGKQKGALWRGHRRGQASLLSIQVGVSVQGYLSCRQSGGGVLTQICLTYNTCDCIFYLMLFSHVLLMTTFEEGSHICSLHFFQAKCKIMSFGEGKVGERHLSF